MRRFSISGLMSFVVFCAIGIASVRYADELWAGILLLLVVLLIGVGLLNVIHQQGKDRAWWTGFLLFAGGYSILTTGPWFSDEIGPSLPTTQLLTYIHDRVAPPRSIAIPSCPECKANGHGSETGESQESR